MFVRQMQIVGPWE